MNALVTEPPCVDVIIASNRVTPFLGEAIRSVVEQTWPNWRLTLVDDGSPESLRHWVADLPRAQYIRQGPKGTSAARNAGLAATSCPLVAFLDDDDIWLPAKLEKQVRGWMEAPEYVGVYHGGTYIDAYGREFGDGWGASQTASRRFLAGEVPMPRIYTLLLRRDMVQHVGGFDESIRTGQEDLDLTLAVLQHGEMLAVPERLVRYRRHDRNVSQAGSLVGRKAVQALLIKQVTMAARRGDRSAEILLKEFLRRQKSDASRETVDGFAAAIARRSLRTASSELLWGLRTPHKTARSAVQKIVSAARVGK